MMYKSKFHSIELSNVSVLVTGGAGFIGSNIIEYFIKNKIGKLRVLDNFSTGFKENIKPYLEFSNFELIEGDIRDFDTCLSACKGMDYICHQAALGSVPRSINDPITTNDVNISGFLNMLVASKENNVKRFVYAASSSTYGDSKELPKVEDRIGRPLSPYAVTKFVNELYADVFSKTYGLEVIGLRYFNIFGPRQNPDGAYAAVIPLFLKAAANSIPPNINGDGSVTRDFTFVENAVQANVRALFTNNLDAINQVYNIACNERTSLNKLWEIICRINKKNIEPNYGKVRQGDIQDSLADISKAEKGLGYSNLIKLDAGLEITFRSFSNG